MDALAVPAIGGKPEAPAIPAGVTTGTTGGVVPIGISAGDGTTDVGKGWTIAGGTACQVALAFPIVCVQRPEPKNLAH